MEATSLSWTGSALFSAASPFTLLHSERLPELDPANQLPYCESKALTITARYQEVGRGWSKKRPEFQRMLADAKKGRFDTIVCWKSDRFSRCMYPAAALMEVVEAHQTRFEAVMDAVDMKTFGLMAAIGKIELENFRERSTMGKRGATKQGRAPTGGLPYGYRIGDDGSPRSQKSRPKLCAASFTCMFITLDVPIESEPATEDSVTVTLLEPSFDGLNRHGKLRYSWVVGLGPFKPGQIVRQ